jgi:SAM-dependent methyltransferase
MLEALQAVRVLGIRGALRLYRAYRLGWMDIIRGYYTTRTLQALFNVGFFDEMGRKGKVDARAFAEARGLDTDILKSLCDSLYALSILGRNGSGYVLEPKGKLLSEVARGWFHGTYGYESVLHELEALLRKEKFYGKDVARRLFDVTRGSGEMEAFLHFPLAIDRLRRAGYRKVLDLGCGDGAFLRAFCAADETATGRGIDISKEMIEHGRALVREAGLEGRVELLVADLTRLDEPPPEARGVDVATVFLLLHEMLFSGDDAALRFLKAYRRLFPGVPLLVFELIRPTADEMRRRPGMAVQYLLHHDLTHQRPVSRKEWKDLFRSAGFLSIDEWHLGFARTSVFALS